MIPGCIILRVSTEEQNEERQLADCMKLAEREGIQVTKSRIFRARESGRFDPGPRKEALKLVRRGAVKAVVVTEISRWARQGARALLNDLALLEHHEARLWSVTQPMIGMPGWGEAVTFFYGLFAAEESAHISERTKSGLAHARRELEREGSFRARRSGKVRMSFGRPPVVTDKAMTVAAYLREVRNLGWAEIARQLQVSKLGDVKASTLRMGVPRWVAKKGVPSEPPPGLQMELPGAPEGQGI